VHFILYSDKSVNECLKSVNERLQVKGTNSRPGLDGWIDKSGMFSVSVNGIVVGKLRRRTNLRAKLERESGYTLVRGDVPSGASPFGIGLMLAGMAAVALVLLSGGSNLLAFTVIPAAAYLFIILRGDDQNSEYLLDELMKMLRAKETPPKVVPKKMGATSLMSKSAAKPVSRASTSKSAAAKPKTASSSSSSTARKTSTATTPAARPPSTPTYR